MSADEMARRITQVTARYPWLVWEAAGVIAGYAYAARWKSRASYRHSVEAAIYLAPSLTGQGIGTQLYQALLRELQEMGTHCVVGGLALPNAASVALHEKLGFCKVAEFPEIGRKLGRWVNVGYWQLTFPSAETATAAKP